MPPFRFTMKVFCYFRMFYFKNYCVDDQLTVMPPKGTFGDYDLCGSNRLDRCSISIERVINRMELLHLMTSYFNLREKAKQCRFNPIYEEMMNRLEILRHGATVHSVLVENDFILLISSDRLCQQISERRLVNSIFHSILSNF